MAQLFIDIIIPHIEDKDLLVIRRLSRAIKSAADKRLFAFIEAETIKIKNMLMKWISSKFHLSSNCKIIPGKYICRGEVPPKIDEDVVLLHLEVKTNNFAMIFRHNIILATTCALVPGRTCEYQYYDNSRCINLGSLTRAPLLDILKIFFV